MKTRLIAILGLTCLMFASCSDDKDDNGAASLVSNETKTALVNKYPEAKHVEWDVKDKYMVAEFKQNGKEVEAWFDNVGNWFMTETDILFNELPGEVQNAFKASEYGNWKVDDVDKVERINTEVIYIIEVEKKGEADVDLYYSADGILVNKVVEEKGNDHSNLIPQNLPEAVKTHLNDHFSGYRLIDVDIEITPQGQYLEVEIIHDNKKKEIYFTTANEWVATTWDLRFKSELPTPVQNAIDTSEYASWKIDDIDYIETTTGIVYQVEFEKEGQVDKKIRYNVDGQIVQ